MLLGIKAKLLQKLDDSSERLFNPQAQLVFQKLVYIWFIGYALHSFPILSLFYGQDAIMMPRIQQGSGVIGNFIYLLNYLRSYYTLVFTIHFISLLFSVFGLLKVFPKVMVVITGWMLYYGCIPAYNGGYLLMMSFAFFMLFMSPKSRKQSAFQMSNLAYLACMLQVCLVYVIAGGYKLTGVSWLSGDAVSRVLYLSAFVSEAKRDWLLNFPIVLSFCTYVSLFYQVAFPLLVWFKKLKPIVLTLGLTFHLGLAIVLNLWDFGLAMIFSYVLFVRNPIEQSKRMLNFRKAL